jgi:flagellar protein FlbD
MISFLSIRDTEGTSNMIELTRLNGSPLVINCDLIKYAEAAPDTVLTLVTGEKLVVLEVCSEVSQRTMGYRAAVLRQAWPEALTALGAKSAHDADQSVRDQAHTALGE